MMSGITVVGLVAFVAALFFLLSWVGWRYFIAPVPADSGVRQSGALPAIEEAAAEHSGDDWLPVLRSGVVAISWLRRLAHGWVLLALLVGGSAIVGVLAVSGWIVPEPLAALDMDRQEHIQIALNPERLVPPPALPPSMFISSERPALETADRDWGRLDPGFTQAVLRVFARLQERGYAFALLEGYRSPERQEKLAALGSHVTNARAFQSKHQYGLAADVAPIKDGRLVISERDPWAMLAYEALGEEAEKSGLTWGGRWWFKDYGHIEARAPIPGEAKAGR